MLSRARVVAILALVFNPLFIPIDYVRLTSGFWLATTLRLLACGALLAVLTWIGRKTAQASAEWISVLEVIVVSIPILAIVRFAHGPGDPLYLVQMIAVVFVIMAVGLFLPLGGRGTFLVAGIPVLLHVLVTFDFPFLENLPVLSATWMAWIIAGVGAQSTFAARLGDYEGRLAKDALIKARADFVAMLSHDIRTPLGVIGGYSEILRESPDLGREEVRDILTRIEAAARSALMLAVNFVQVSRIEGQSLQLNRKPVDVSHVLRDVAVHHRCLADVKRIRLIEECADDLPLVEADGVQLDRVFANLVDNAIKFTPPGGSVRVAAEAKDGRAIEVVVEDTGEGIAAESLGTLFQRYSGTSSLRDSTGLGLFIVKTITEAHGGSVGAENRTDRSGARFRVILPLTGGTVPSAPSSRLPG